MTRSSPPRAEPRRCRERHAAWLFKSRLHAACTRQIACQQAAKLSAWRLKRQRCLRGPDPRLLPSLFFLLWLRLRFSPPASCSVKGRGAPSRGGVGRRLTLPAPAAAGATLCPQPASGAEIFHEGASAVAGSGREARSAGGSSTTQRRGNGPGLGTRSLGVHRSRWIRSSGGRSGRAVPSSDLPLRSS